MELVPLDRILSSIRNKTDRKLYPKNEPARSWGEERLLREIAESYTRTDIVPNLIAAWSTAAAAGKAPADPSRASREGSPPAVEMPDDTDELRSRHDDEHAPAGPHSLVHPDAALGVSQEAAGAPDPSPAVQVPPEPGDGSTVPPENGSAPPDDSVAEPGPEPVSELPDGAPSDVAAAALVVPAPPVPDGRAAVLAAFNRNRTPPSPQPAAPQPSRPAPPQARPAERPWFAAQKVPQQESEMTDDGWRFVLEGYVVGSVAWATKHGPPPGSEGCRVPRRVLKEFKF